MLLELCGGSVSLFFAQISRRLFFLLMLGLALAAPLASAGGSGEPPNTSLSWPGQTLKIDAQSIQLLNGKKRQWQNEDAYKFISESARIVADFLFVKGITDGAFTLRSGFILDLRSGNTVDQYGGTFLFRKDSAVYLGNNFTFDDNREQRQFANIKLLVFDLRTREERSFNAEISSQIPALCAARNPNYWQVTYLNFQMQVDEMLIYGYESDTCKVVAQLDTQTAEATLLNLIRKN